MGRLGKFNEYGSELLRLTATSFSALKALKFAHASHAASSASQRIAQEFPNILEFPKFC